MVFQEITVHIAAPGKKHLTKLATTLDLVHGKDSVPMMNPREEDDLIPLDTIPLSVG